MEEFNEIAAKDLSKIIQSNDWVTLDVRLPKERSAGFLPGLHIPLENLEQEFHQLPQAFKLLIYCRCGNRSVTAIKKLRDLNFDGELYNLNGGILSVHKERAKSGMELLLFPK